MSTKECRTVSRRLSARLDGRLAPWEDAEVREHLAGCSRCESEWEELEELRRTLTAVPTPAPRPDALQRLHRALPTKRARAAWAPAVCGVALLMAAAALVQQQLADRDGTGSPAPQATPSSRGALEGATARAQVHRADAHQAMAGSLAEAEVQAAETRTGGTRRAERPARRRGKRSAPPPPETEPGSRILVVVSHSRVAPERAGEEAPKEPGTEIFMTRLEGEDGQPEAELIVGRTIGEDLNVQRIMIAYHPIREEELGTTTPELAEPSEESTDERKQGDVLSDGDEDRDARSHPRVGLPSTWLPASEA